MKGPEFLGSKYNDLDTSRPVERAAEKVGIEDKDKTGKVDAYLARIERILESERGTQLLEHMIEKDFVLDTSDDERMRELAHDLYESEKKIAEAQGRGGDVERLEDSGEDLLARYQETILEKAELQRESLRSWTNYLKQNDAQYPMWFRYYVMRSLRDMGDFNRDEATYSSRTEKTLAPFPELNAEALSFTKRALEQQMLIDSIEIPDEIEQEILQNTELDEATKAKIANIPEEHREAAYKGALKNARNKKRSEYINEQKGIQQQAFLKGEINTEKEGAEDIAEQLLKRLDTKRFDELYAFAQVETAGSIDKASLEGEWVKYDQGSDASLLEAGLKGKGTGWCTAEGSAPGQLEQGDFYVYYTKNSEGEATEPRVAIRMENGSIAEIRGIDKQQEMEPELVPIAKEFYQDLPGAEKYEQADYDMKLMTKLYERAFDKDPETGELTYKNPQFTKDELTFLYELDHQIKGFGYDRDPRIEKLRSERNIQEDMPILFDCEPSQIATTREEVNKDIKVYNGALYPNIFKELPDTVEKIYTNFPEKISEVCIKEIEIPTKPKTAEEYEKELTREGHKIHDWAKDILSKADLETGQGQKIKLIIPSNKSLGFSQGATREESKQRAQELGIAQQTLPAIVGPELRMRYTDQPNPGYILVDMESIFDRVGDPRVFFVYCFGSASWLYASDGRPDNRWSADGRWAFSQ